MRVAIDNGNGCACDICGNLVPPHKAFKLNILKLDEDKKKASTGCYQTKYRADLCPYCVEKVKGLFKNDRTK